MSEVCVFERHWFRVIVAVPVLVLVIGVACRGDDGSEPTPLVVASTFTPRPEGETPTAASTEVVSTPSAVTTPSGTREPTPTPGPNEIRPPELVLITASGRSVGLVSANGWYDPETETFSGFEFSGQVFLAIDPIEWPLDSDASFEVQDSPYPAGATEIAFYTYDDNIATPINPQGQVIGTDPAFVIQEDPVADVALEGPPLTLPNPVPSGKYIIEVAIHWPVPPDIARELPNEAKTQYVFVIVVP